MVDAFRLAVVLAYQAPFICIVLSLYVFFSMKRNGLTQKQFLLMRGLAIGSIFLMVFEVLVGMVQYRLLNWDVRSVRVFMFLAYLSLLFNTVLLDEFCISRIQCPSKVLCGFVRGMYFITAVFLVARLVCSGTELFVFFDGEGSIKFGPLDDVQTWCCAVADVFTAALVMKKYYDKNEYADHEKYGKLLSAVLLVFLAIFTYVMIYLPYIIWIGNLLAVLYLYTGMQGLLIYTDELTSLGNRRRMLQDIHEKSKEEWSYILADVNQFKMINDTYGHNEGDRALIAVADVLNDIALLHGSKAYRIGGDEFALVLPLANEDAVSAICLDIRDRLNEHARNIRLPYELTVSCGFSLVSRDSVAGVAEIMEAADQRMYEKKQSSRKSRKKNK